MNQMTVALTVTALFGGGVIAAHAGGISSTATFSTTFATSVSGYPAWEDVGVGMNVKRETAACVSSHPCESWRAKPTVDGGASVSMLRELFSATLLPTVVVTQPARVENIVTVTEFDAGVKDTVTITATNSSETESTDTITVTATEPEIADTITVTATDLPTSQSTAMATAYEDVEEVTTTLTVTNVHHATHAAPSRTSDDVVYRTAYIATNDTLTPDHDRRDYDPPVTLQTKVRRNTSFRESQPTGSMPPGFTHFSTVIHLDDYADSVTAAPSESVTATMTQWNVASSTSVGGFPIPNTHSVGQAYWPTSPASAPSMTGAHFFQDQSPVATTVTAVVTVHDSGAVIPTPTGSLKKGPLAIKIHDKPTKGEKTLCEMGLIEPPCEGWAGTITEKKNKKKRRRLRRSDDLSPRQWGASYEEKNNFRLEFLDEQKKREKDAFFRDPPPKQNLEPDGTDETPDYTPSFAEKAACNLDMIEECYLDGEGTYKRKGESNIDTGLKKLKRDVDLPNTQ